MPPGLHPQWQQVSVGGWGHSRISEGVHTGPELILDPPLAPASIFCHKCEGLCPKECKVGTKTIDSIQAAQDLVGCTHVEGSLIVNLRQGCQYLPRGAPLLLAMTLTVTQLKHCFPSPRVPVLRAPSLHPVSTSPPTPLLAIHFPRPAAALSSPFPDNLELELQHSLGLIETITGFLKIKHSFALVSLGFFKNLKLIRGDAMVDG